MQAEVTSDPGEEKPELLHNVSKFNNITDDSGYSSDVLVSPDPKAVRVHEVAGTSTSEESYCLTPDVTKRTIERWTSTPQSDSSVSLPKLEALDDGTKTLHCSRDLVLDLSSPIEICELELTCKEVANRLNNMLSKNEQPKVFTNCEKQEIKQKESLSNFSGKCRKPKHVFIQMLKEAEYLIYKVLKYLSGQDLLHISHVNSQLREVILGNKRLNDRRVAFVNGRRRECERVGKENLKVKMLNEGSSSSSFGALSPRKALSTIQNLQPTSPLKASSTIGVISHTGLESFVEMEIDQIYPIDIKQFSGRRLVLLDNNFLQEGQKLPQGEELQKCVKCKSPAMVQKSQQRAVCSRKKCGYDYCTRCHLSFHRRPQDCSVLKPRTRQGNGIFSNKCKRSLRRL